MAERNVGNKSPTRDTIIGPPDGGPLGDEPDQDLIKTVSDEMFEADEAEPEGEPESIEEFLLRPERAVARSELGSLIDKGLRSLARAARSFLLYDHKNEAIRAFLEGYRNDMLDAARRVSAVHPEGIELVVRPFELIWQGEVVYLERDRERSLAFRMFRDGLRRMTLGAEVTWEELLSLLQILSIRYTGVRQQEEDIVTLLWKAGFDHIEVVAVEGFVPEDDADDDELDPEGLGQGGATRRASSHVDAPRDFDQPIPVPLPGVEVTYTDLTDEQLAELQQETSSRVLPEQSVHLVQEMVKLVVDPTDPTQWRDIDHLVSEVRDFLLAEGQLERLVDLVKALDILRRQDESQLDKLLSGFIDTRALARILHSVPASQNEVPATLLWLVENLPGDHLKTSLAALSIERGPSARRVARQLVARFISRDPEAVVEAVSQREDAVAADILRAVADSAPDLWARVLDVAIARDEADLLFESLKVLERIDDDKLARPRLLTLLDANIEEVRLKALEQLTSRRLPGTYQAVQEALVRRVHVGIRPREADAYGRSLVRLDAVRAAEQLSEWIRPKSLFKRVFHDPVGHGRLQWAAVSGLGTLPGDDHEQLIRWLEARAGSELARHCVRTLAMRRREQADG